jgi:hypothetical protein
MGFAGYVAVCMQLYCRGKLSLFYTTCFGLYGHLQECRMLLLSCSWRNLLRWLFHILHVVTLLYISICVFLFYFSRFILLFLACAFICLSFRVDKRIKPPSPDLTHTARCKHPRLNFMVMLLPKECEVFYNCLL